MLSELMLFIVALLLSTILICGFGMMTLALIASVGIRGRLLYLQSQIYD